MAMHKEKKEKMHKKKHHEEMHEKHHDKKHEKHEHEKKEHHKPKKKAMKKVESKIKKVAKEFGEGKLHSGSKKGPIVTNPKQMIAIGYSEAKRAKKKK